MKVRATAKYIGTSSRKIGLVAGLIRGQSVPQALVTLSAAPQRATGPVGKVLSSAVANAENNYGLRRRDLVVDSVLVGPSRTLKRFRPRARGAAYPVRKRSSHITVIVSDQQAVTKPAPRPAPTAAEATTTAPAATKTATTTKKRAAKPAAKEKQ